MSSEITLFDLASKPPCRSWSLNAWRARLVLNYKSIPYTTHWLEYPEIAPHHKSHSIPPNPHNPAALFSIPYTVPTIHIPDSGPNGIYIMDSLAIAHELEKRYPSPPLHLDTPQQAKILDLWPQLLKRLGPAMLPKTARILSEGSLSYFIETREKMSGLKLSELEKGEEQMWKDAEPMLKEIGAVLRENEGGPFVLGEEISYADFVLVGMMQFLQRLGDGIYERLVGVEPVFGRLYEACKGLVERDT